MNILHITSVLPAPVSNKKDENDILLRLTNELIKNWPDDNHSFIFVIPYSNFFLSKLKRKWKDYFSLIKTGQYSLNNLTIHVVGVPGFKGDSALRPLFAKLAYNVLFRNRIRKITDQARPDLIHAHNMIHNMELAECLRRESNLRMVVTARNINKSALSRLRSRKVKAEKILTLNRLNTNRCENIPELKEKVVMIPHPIDEVFFQKNNSFRSWNKKLSLISVGKLIKLKNIDKVIRALAGIEFDFTYTIIGEGPEKKYLQELVDAFGLEKKVFFIGFIPHEKVKDELIKHELMIMPSYPETLGRVYFEAMASGLPVIAAKESGIDGMIEENVHGFMVNHHSVEEISDAIRKFAYLSDDEKHTMSESAKLFAGEFTWESTLSKYYKFYHA
jgi:glycosyltransferase involved in cell wall biosynthesis